MKIDVSTYMDKFLDSKLVEKYSNRKDEIFQKLNQANMNGWLNPDVSFVDQILEVRDEVLSHSKCLVVVGIGGSFLGAKSFYELFTPYFKKNDFPIIFAGTTLSSTYMKELLEYLETIDFTVNVISKSGTTRETALTYSALKKLLERKYRPEEVKKHIIVTTDPVKGTLRDEVNREGYRSFIIPDNIGGRYSLLTAAHLFPLSFCIDVKELILGYKEGVCLQDDAFSYSVCRRSLFDLGKVVENFVTYENNWYYYLEWLKQLFGETEGKDGKGILPISMIHTRDLHSLGQFVQEGNKIIYETFFKINNMPICDIDGKDLHKVNLIVEDSVISAHVSGGVPCIVIELDDISPRSMGRLSAFFFLVAAYSGYLFDINPFDQPGVEVYKAEVKRRLG
ncbi:MAG: glucose-6-phosphate isomerase [bacterium]|nr:glucose-6-phosphate isomerase [Mycoplasmatota bacterium]MDD6757759.1 glucose-6-phosphate isomerase [bacterium]